MKNRISALAIGISCIAISGCATNPNNYASFKEVLADNKNGRLYAGFYIIDGGEAVLANLNFRRKANIGKKYCESKNGKYEKVSSDPNSWKFPIRSVADGIFGTFKCTPPTETPWFVVNEIIRIERDQRNPYKTDVYFIVRMSTKADIDREAEFKKNAEIAQQQIDKFKNDARAVEAQLKIMEAQSIHKIFKDSITSKSIGREICRDSGLAYQVYINSSVLGHNFETILEAGGVVATIDGYSPDKERLRVVISNFFTDAGRLRYSPYGNIQSGDISIIPGSTIWTGSFGWRYC